MDHNQMKINDLLALGAILLKKFLKHLLITY